MSFDSISPLTASVVHSSTHAFCVDPEVLKQSRTDDRWVEVPKKGEYYMTGIEECSIDIWGEEYCSMNSRFRPITGDNGKPIPMLSCSKAQSNDPSTFEYIRKLIENQPWTLTEMSKALKWIFNCTGKLPVQTCAQN